MKDLMRPILFDPDYKELVWGGTKLKTLFNKPIPYKKTGESWEIASHKNGHSIVRDGVYQGLTLEEMLLEHGEAIMGQAFGPSDKFPLLVKLIDAKSDLSVQVHPDDVYAALHEDGELGKSEAWMVLNVEPGSRLVIGLQEGTTKEMFERAIKEDCIEDVLNQLEVQPGDVINIPAGLLHAIGAGVLLAEIQQNSDTTYRVYDWKRVGLDGKSRALHLQQSLDTIDFDHKFSTVPTLGSTVKTSAYEHTCYIVNPYFAFETIQIFTHYIGTHNVSYELYMVIEGEGVIEGDFGSIPVVKGDSMLIPFCLKGYTFKGQLQLLKTYVPEDIETTLQELEQLGFSRKDMTVG